MLRRAGVQRHAHLQLADSLPVRRAQRPLRLERAGERILRRVERHAERVADRLEHITALRFERLAQQAIVRRQRRRAWPRAAAPISGNCPRCR